MRKESEKVARAFLQGHQINAARSWSTGTALLLHGHEIVKRVTRDGKQQYALCMHGYPSNTTRDRLNAFTELAFGERMFSVRKGVTYFGGGLLREVDPHETIYIPIDFKPGDHHERTARADTGKAPAHQSRRGMDGHGHPA